MQNYQKIGRLQVASELYEFVNNEALPESGLNQDTFWKGFDELLHDLIPENKKLLETRVELQEKIDHWHKENGQGDFGRYKSFLESIGYLEPEADDFKISTSNVDEEITSQAGPQLVVPADNKRYAANAANARWGSLYDALYGTDVISDEDGAEAGSDYNPKRGAKVVEYAKSFLDKTVPLKGASHADAVQYSISGRSLHVKLENGDTVKLESEDQLQGYQGSAEEPTSILLKHNNLHADIQIDRSHPIGKTDGAGVKDVVLESATTTIIDCEDSVAAVDAEDKTNVYSNILGLMKGTLTAEFNKGGKTMTRKLNADREYTSLDGGKMSLHGRALLFMRNVGHLMTTDAILDENGNEVPEGIMDGVITSLAAKHDVLGTGELHNSKEGSVYIVKPKMHGSKEVAFANKLFERIEDLLELKRNTLKIGVMDEERRTTINLKNCIKEVRERVVFINTGFLDRTGDEIHTSMECGPMIRKSEMKSSIWLGSYEKSNVDVGLGAGLKGRAQIGKGMWAMPSLMALMLEQKSGQLKAGANTAWVPSPTAATLHALHYHEVNVHDVQEELAGRNEDHKDNILTIPVDKQAAWNRTEIQEELDNNAQGLLGYVVRWVEHGVGCSTVPDINNVGLMEDRATLRISSQHMTNWLHQGICTREQIEETLLRMAKVVDEQNADDADYRNMSDDPDQSVAFQAARDLVFKGTEQPSGYTEPILHRRRREVKEALVSGRK